METQAEYKNESKDLYLTQIDTAKKEGCNVLLPTARLEGLSEYHVPVLDRVQLNSDSSQGDVYVQEQGNQKKKTKYAITKQGLMKLSVCAGIIWHPMETRRTDNRNDKNYVSFQAVGGVRKADGTPVFMKAEYDLDFDVVADELEEQYRNKAEGYEAKPDDNGWWMKKSPEEKEAYIQKCIRRDLLQKRKHKMKLCESGAMTRVIRALLGLKSTYTKEELEKPFVVPRIVVQLDYSDPTVKAKLMDAAIRAQTGIYGGGAAADFQNTRLPYEEAIPVETIPEDEADHIPENLNEPEPWPDQESPEVILERQKIEFQKATKEGKIQIINYLIKRKGWDTSKLKSPLGKYPEEKLTPFFEHLLAMQDKPTAKPADDDIPL